MNTIKKLVIFASLLIMLFAMAVPVCASTGAEATTSSAATVQDENGKNVAEVIAATETESSLKSTKAIAAAVTIGVAAVAGAIGMALAICKAVDGIARQPEADGKIRTSLMLGLVFVETAIIYALIVAILIVFVL